MPATKKNTKQVIKNSVTGSVYHLRKRSEVNPETGKIEGRWSGRGKKGNKA